MAAVIKVVAHRPEQGGKLQLRDNHPERVIINFEASDDGSVSFPMAYRVWSDKTLPEDEIAAIYEALRDGCVADELPSGTYFVQRRQLL